MTTCRSSLRPDDRWTTGLCPPTPRMLYQCVCNTKHFITLTDPSSGPSARHFLVWPVHTWNLHSTTSIYETLRPNVSKLTFSRHITNKIMHTFDFICEKRVNLDDNATRKQWKYGKPRAHTRKRQKSRGWACRTWAVYTAPSGDSGPGWILIHLRGAWSPKVATWMHRSKNHIIVIFELWRYCLDKRTIW